MMLSPVQQNFISNIKEKCSKIRPLVAIHCITYNHEAYIKAALDGFVMQQTEFPFVAIIHDDASTDNTKEIIREYAKKFPDIIIPIFEKENQYSKGNVGRIMQVAITVSGAKYFAMCEGDDYWLDSQKLQNQVEFLNTHPDYSMIGHNAVVEYDNGSKELFNSLMKSKELSYYEIVSKWYLPTASVMVKTEVITKYDDKIQKIYSGDYRLILMARIEGKIYYENSIMSVYRKSFNRTSASALYSNKNLFIIKQWLLLLNSIKKIVNKEYKKAINKRIRYLKHELSFQEAKINQNYFSLLNHPIFLLKKIWNKMKVSKKRL